MKLDETAAVYGLIQVVFADVTDRLARAVFILQKQHGANVTFEQIFRSRFQRILDEFKDELKQLDKARLQEARDIQVLRETCNELATLAGWRNDRIHARVQSVDDGLALYDWRTRKRLSISYEECEVIVIRLTKVITNLEGYLPAVASNIKLEKEIDAFFDHAADEQGVTTEP